MKISINSENLVAFGDTTDRPSPAVFKDSCLCTQNSSPAQTFKDNCMCSQQPVGPFKDSCLCTQHLPSTNAATQSTILMALAGGTVKTLADFAQLTNEVKTGARAL